MAPQSDLRSRSSAQPSSSGDPKSIPEVVSELWELATSYAKQETIDPLKGLGRFLGYGVGGAIFLGVGAVLVLLAALRAIQTQTSTTFTGNLSWAPYLLTAAAGLLLIALAVLRVSKRKGPGA